MNMPNESKMIFHNLLYVFLFKAIKNEIVKKKKIYFLSKFTDISQINTSGYLEKEGVIFD